MSDYLFDKQGEPDADVEQLEQLLAPLAHAPRPLPPLPSRAPARLPARRVWLAAGALAAAALVALVVWRPWRPGPQRIAYHREMHGGTIAVGEWLWGPADLDMPRWGHVRLEPGAKVRVIVATAADERIELAHGKLTASITAPPRQFAIVTPHATVVDLGCEFSVAVDETGQGRVVVITGRVAVTAGAGEVVVPAGSECELTANGPSPPHASAPTPNPAPAPAPVPTPTPTHATTQHHPAHKPAHKITHAPAHATPAKTSTSPAAAKATPAKKPTQDDSTKLHHDALKGLEKSIP